MIHAVFVCRVYLGCPIALFFDIFSLFFFCLGKHFQNAVINHNKKKINDKRNSYGLSLKPQKSGNSSQTNDSSIKLYFL